MCHCDAGKGKWSHTARMSLRVGMRIAAINDGATTLHYLAQTESKTATP